MMPGWPDEGRRIVQGPHLRSLLDRATRESKSLPVVFNPGCGEGGYSRLLLALPGLDLLIESDSSFHERIHRPDQSDKRQVFFGSSLESVPLANRTAHFILCTEVLEHVVLDGQALDELARVVARGGWLLITVPTPPAVRDCNHVREGYRKDELCEMLRTRGFQIVEIRFCMYYFFRLLLCLWPRMRYRPRLFIRALAFIDRLIAIGPPMDLMILARAI